MDEFNSVRKPGSGNTKHTSPGRSTKRRGTNNTWLIIGVAAVVVIILLIIVFAIASKSKKSSDSGSTNTGKEQNTSLGTVKKDTYQAVFLTNGQVYFGKIDTITDDYVKLNDIYYLQVAPALQQKAAGSNADDTSGQQLSLAKLGSELHGPEDTMYIARDQILFWENLKSDGKVVQAINQNKESSK